MPPPYRRAFVRAPRSRHICLSNWELTLVSSSRAKYPQLRNVLRRHTRTAPPSLCAASATLARASSRSFDSDSSSTFSALLSPPCPTRCVPQPFPARAAPARTASHIRIHCRAQRSSALCDHLRQPSTATATSPRPAAAPLRARDWAVASCWRRARTPLLRFALQAHLTRAPLQCAFSAVLVYRRPGAARHGWAWAGCGGPLRVCSRTVLV